jgi:hypothetical protein
MFGVFISEMTSAIGITLRLKKTHLRFCKLYLGVGRKTILLAEVN